MSKFYINWDILSQLLEDQGYNSDSLVTTFTSARPYKQCFLVNADNLKDLLVAHAI